MKIDCERCPVRARACDGCMMQVFVGSATSEFGPGGEGERQVTELVAAIDVFADTELISEEGANEARRHVTAGEGSFTGGWLGGLRAV